MNRKSLILIASGGSALMILGALAFQYLGDMAPCKLCIWQRWPHVIAAGLGLIALALPGRLIPCLGALAALATAVGGLYHTGVERHWWQGPTSCTSSGTGGMSAGDLFDKIMTAPLVRCDEVPWEMFGLSMASWNAVISLGLALIWVMAIRAKT